MRDSYLNQFGPALEETIPDYNETLQTMIKLEEYKKILNNRELSDFSDDQVSFLEMLISTLMKKAEIGLLIHGHSDWTFHVSRGLNPEIHQPCPN